MGKRSIVRLFAAAALAGSLASLPLLWLSPADFLAQQWRDLDALAEDELAVRLQQLADLGEPGLVIVLQALDDPRDEVAAAARETLEQQLDRWQQLKVRQSSPRVARLARLLAEQVPQSGREARQAYADLATRILLWPIDGSRVDGAQLVSHCESVLRAAPQEGPGGATASPSGFSAAAEPNSFGRQAAEVWTAPLSAEPEAALSELETRITPLPGGDLPVGLAGSLAAPPAAKLQENRAAGSREPQLFHGPAAPPLEAAAPVKSKDTATADPPPDDDSGSQLPGDGGRPARETWISVPRLEPPPAALTEVELMRRLQDEDQAQALAAAAELERRGFQQLHLRLARQVFDRDPQQRAQLVETLPRLAGIDARPWLLLLSQDDDPLVRRRVIALIATSEDPVFRERLLEIEREESDPDTLRLVRRILYPSRRE